MIGQQMIAPNQRMQAMGAMNSQISGNGLPVGMIGPAGALPTVQSSATTPALPITANTTMAPTGLPVQMSANGAPPTGLIGSEAALAQGLAGSEAALAQGQSAAEAALAQGQAGAESALGSSYWMARDESDRYRQALNKRSLTLDTSLGQQSVDAIDQGVSAFDPYTQGGSNAQKLYDDMTGVNGPEAQAAAQSAYQSSPALQYQMDQMQKATERSAAARGGLMSGSVLQELQRNAQGLASQDYFKNLGAVGESANRGLNAASGVAGLRGQQAQMGAQLQGIGLQSQAQYEMQKESIRSDIANRLTGLAENAGINMAGLKSDYAKTSAGLQTGYGQTVASGRERNAQDVAAGRTNAGMAMAQNATQAAGNIANYLNQQGVGVSDMMSKDISSITDFMYQSGMQDKADMQNLADLIARINGAQGATVMQGQQAIGAANAAGALGVGNAIQGGITQGIATGLIG